TFRIVGVMSELLELNQRSRDLLSARVKEGAAPEIELNLVDVEVRRLEADRAIESADVEAGLIELKALIGLAPDEDLKLRDDLERVVASQSPAASTRSGGAVDETIAGRPDIREAVARTQMATARVKQLVQEAKPEWSLYAG